MLLRSLTKHVSDQNWFAVAIDFFIVVIGVFMGVQVANWNADRAEQERIKIQLESFREELVLAQDDIETYETYITDRLSSTKKLRAILADPEKQISDEEVYTLTMSAIRSTRLDVSFRGYEEFATTGVISKIGDKNLRQQLYKWDSALSKLRTSETDANALRDAISFPPILSVLSFGNLARTDERYADMPVADRFALDMQTLREDRDFDNALTARTITEAQKLDALTGFETATEELIATLGGEK